MSDTLKNFFDRHSRKNIEYLEWPIKELSDYLFTELGDFVIIAGSPSSGKTAFALQCVKKWAKKYKVGFFSLETSPEKIFDRYISMVCGIDMTTLKRNDISDEQWAKVAQSSTDITSCPLDIIPAAGMSPADIRAVTLMKGYQIIVVDYVQLVKGTGENRTAQVTDISISLHTMAQSLGVTVIGLSQLKRQQKDQKSKGPELSDLRESGQLEQDADLVMMLSLGKDETKERDLRIKKNKEGTLPNVHLTFDGAHQTFFKASDGGREVAAEYSAQGKHVRSQNARDAKKKAEVDGQFSILPDTERVPFEN